MNIYRITALVVVLIIAAHVFHVQDAITTFLNHIADIPQFGAHAANTPIFRLAVRCIYLIAVVGVIKIIFRKREDKED